MELKEVSLCNFRNIGQAEVSFSPGVNLICGENAQGKTSLLEAVYLLSAAKSFRTRRARELLRHGEERGFAEASFVRKNSPHASVKMELSKNGQKRVLCCGAEVSKLSEFIGVLRVVLFVPEHLAMVKEGPAHRRSFLDSALCQLSPLYPSYLNQYAKLYAVRCTLLRQVKEDARKRELFALYDEKTAQVSAKIAQARRAYVAELLPLVFEQYAQISEGREALSVAYESDIPAECRTESEARDFALSLLQNNLETDIRCGFPVKGVHRDDLALSLDNQSARAYASQGQQRSIVLSLKLAEGMLAEARGEESPVYLLDDVLSELDRARRNFVLSRIGDKQTILTSCETPRQKALSQARRIAVREGRFY